MNPVDAHVLAALRSCGSSVTADEVTYQMLRNRRPAHPDVTAALDRLVDAGLAYHPYDELRTYTAATTRRAVPA